MLKDTLLPFGGILKSVNIAEFIDFVMDITRKLLWALPFCPQPKMLLLNDQTETIDVLNNQHAPNQVDDYKERNNDSQVTVITI